MRHVILAYYRSETIQTTNLDSWRAFVITSGGRGVCRVATSAYTAVLVSVVMMMLSCICLMVVVYMFPRCFRDSTGLSMTDSFNMGSACDGASIEELELLDGSMHALSIHLITTYPELLHAMNRAHTIFQNVSSIISLHRLSCY
jgi:hypothetical protein